MRKKDFNVNKVQLKGQTVEIKGNFLTEKAKAPDFSLVEDSLKIISLHDLKGVKLLSIVPSLDTEVCLTSTRKMNEQAKKRPDISFLIISADLPFAQKRVCGLENLSNIKTLSTMGNTSFAQDYGVLIASGPLKGLCARAIIILDESDQVVYSELVPEISQEPNYDKAFECLNKI